MEGPSPPRACRSSRRRPVLTVACVVLALASGLPSCAQAFTFASPAGASSLAPLPSSRAVATRQLAPSSAEALMWRLGSSASAALVSRPQQQQQQQQRHRSLRLHNSMGLGISELEIIKRLVMATFAGAAIGFERRYSERPAGLRTMAYVLPPSLPPSLPPCFSSI